MASPLWRQRLASVSSQIPLFRLQIMPNSRSKTGKPSPFILYLLAFVLTLFFSLSWVNAKEAKKPKLEPWQIDGIMAALDDGHDKVKEYALNKLAEYDQSSLGNKQESIAEKAATILNDEKVDANVRGKATSALGSLRPSAAKYIPDILKFLNDEKVDANVRASAATALGNLGLSWAKYIPDYVKILKDTKVNTDVRGKAARVLSNLGPSAAKYIPDILKFLKDAKINADVRGKAARVLGNLGPSAVKYIPDILKFLNDEKVDANVRVSAATALGNLGVSAAKYIPDILKFLNDEKVDAYVRGSTARALGNLRPSAAKYVPDLVKILNDEKVDAHVRGFAATALGNLRPSAIKYVPDLVKILNDEKVDTYIRASAATALGNLGASAAKYTPDILKFLNDKKVDADVRGEAARALGNLGPSAAKYIPDILKILNDEKVDANVRGEAARALGNLGPSAAKYIPDLVKILKDEKVDADVRRSAARALGNIRRLELEEVFVILNYVYEPNQGKFSSSISEQSDFESWRFFTYFLGGGTEEVKTLVKWLGYPKETPDKLTHNESRKTLEILLKAWNSSQELERLQSDLARQIAAVTKKVTWQWQDINLLQSHYNNLKNASFNEADTVLSVINQLEFWKWFFLFTKILLIHFAIWLILIITYPKFPQILSTLFWNPWLRLIFGLGYIGFLLAVIPFLRQRLFEPFKSFLLADASLNNFDDQAYFPDTMVRVRGLEENKAITEVIPSLKGQIILQGDSGLGKSMFLRHLVKNSQRIVAYLPARKCDRGVVEAIQAKLQGQVQNTNFLKNLIQNGAIDICIDGLNEVTADTRAKIGQFVESYFRGNIIMTTQPLEWIPPSMAVVHELQPLKPQQIEKFLLSRKQRFPQDASVQGAKYEQVCQYYLSQTLNEQQPSEELKAAYRILSNPMDLTLVALMLSQGKPPDLFRLQQQQYNQIAEEYQQKWKHEFPLKKFSFAVYQMQLQDEKALPEDIFHQEIESMEDEKYKMVVSRQWEDTNGEARKEWYFRHDKIMDFFLVQNFLEDSEEAKARVTDHMGDPRFRGVYFLLAGLLPLNAALELREKFILYAANTKDHTVTDTFVQLIQLRWSQGAQEVTFKQVLRQQEQKAQFLDWVTQFLELIGGKIIRERELYLTVETIEGSLGTYTPLPVLVAVDTPNDRDVVQIVEFSKKLDREPVERVGLLIYKFPPDTTARMEMAKVRLRDRFVLIPIPLTSIETTLSNKFDCVGLLEEYVDRYLQRADFFDDKNAISDTFSFFGRTEILQRLGEELLRYQGIGLFGLRKSGKTSVLLQLSFLLREHPVVHIDLQRYGGSRYGAALFNDILQRLSALETDIQLPQFEPFSHEKLAAELTAEFIQRFSELARAIEKNNKYKLPIFCFLDEVERIIPTPEDHWEKAEEFNACFGALRVLNQEQRQLSLLVADVHPDCNRMNTWNQEGVSTNPVFSFFKEIFLPPFSQEETQDMLTNIGKLMGLEFDEETLRQIHGQSGGHPFVSRQLARFLTEKIKQNGSGLVEWEVVGRYLDKALSRKGELKNYVEKSIWEDLEKRDFQVAIAVLKIIACNELDRQGITEQALLNQLSANFTTNQCSDACHWLTNVGLLYQEEIEHQDIYQIRIPLLSRWIQMQMTEEEIEQCKIL
ncbi:HEAT repeat domain-containing protein [Scytonema hofmannii]|uniref:HEAT repeat domain-containing protein n=1 Tax=Scytonema hofmannii TaxID=34078 RepID=UPI000345A310|nr:HEAT repeat domain-containing protein [Scytonema hofmannii]